MIFRHGGGNPFYLEQLARAKEEGKLEAALGERGTAAGVPPAVAASLAEELAALSQTERVLLEAAAVAGEPFEPDLAAAIAELPRGRGPRRARRAARPRPRAPDDGPAALHLPPSRSCAARCTSRRAAAGGWPPTRRAADRAGRARGRPPPSARTTSSSPPRRATRRRSRCCSRRAPRRPRAPRPRRRAGSRRRCGCCRTPTTRARWRCACRSRRRCARWASSSAAARRCSRRSTCSRPTTGARRVELTALCAAVEHWLGRHDEAHDRLVRAWEELPDRDTRGCGRAAGRAGGRRALRAGLRADARPRAAARSRRRAPSATARCSRRRPRRCALGEAAAGEIEPAREHRAEALALVDALSDDELAPRLEALYYLGWAENYLEHYDEAIAHADRGIAIARATGEGRLLVPMMLVKGYPFEMQGRLAEAIELCEAAVEAARLSANPHYLFWALFELGFAHYYAGDLDGGDRGGRGERARRPRLTGGTMPAAGGGPGWLLAAARFEAGEVDRAREDMQALGGDRARAQDPGGALLRLGDRWRSSSWRVGRARRRRGPTCAAPRRTPPGSACGCRPRSRCGPARRCCWPTERPRTRPRVAPGVRRRRRRGRRAAAGRLLARARRAARSPPRASGRRPSRRCARPRASSTRAARCACATRCAASCASSARAPRCAGPAAAGRLRGRGAHQARAARSPSW